jgi:hypothetical protein
MPDELVLILAFDRDHPDRDLGGTFQPQSDRASYEQLARSLSVTGPVRFDDRTYHGDRWGDFAGVWITPETPEDSRFPDVCKALLSSLL